MARLGSIVLRTYAVSFATAYLGAGVALLGLRGALARSLFDPLQAPLVGWVFAGASVGALVMGTVTAALTRKRLRVLSRALEQLGARDFSVDLPDPPVEEMAAVRESFRQMRDRVRGTVSDLQAAEAERRKQIRRVAHDLSNPVTTLMCVADTLTELDAKESGAEREAAWRSLNAEIDRVAGMIDDLRALARSPEQP